MRWKSLLYLIEQLSSYLSLSSNGILYCRPEFPFFFHVCAQFYSPPISQVSLDRKRVVVDSRSSSSSLYSCCCRSSHVCRTREEAHLLVFSCSYYYTMRVYSVDCFGLDAHRRSGDEEMRADQYSTHSNSAAKNGKTRNTGELPLLKLLHSLHRLYWFYFAISTEWQSETDLQSVSSSLFVFFIRPR